MSWSADSSGRRLLLDYDQKCIGSPAEILALEEELPPPSLT
jgi:hypothetical protein